MIITRYYPNTGRLLTQTAIRRMHHPSSKLTSKYQATIPEPVRRILQLGAGDKVAFAIGDDGSVRLSKAQLDEDEGLALMTEALSEWGSAADEDAYRGI